CGSLSPHPALSPEYRGEGSERAPAMLESLPISSCKHLPILPRSPREVGAKLAAEMALVGKPATDRHVGQGFVRVNQRTSRHPHLKLAKILLRRHVEAGAEFSLEGADRHVRQLCKLPIADVGVVMI